MLDINQIRQDFPILHQKVYGKQFIYLDNGATTQKPQSVIDVMTNYYSHANSNIHRGVHFFSEKATAAYENARRVIKEFINAAEQHEIIFTSGTTDGINLIAFSFGERFVKEGDEILVSEMEHHSNIVPWQLLCERKKAVLKVIPFDDNGELLMDEYEKLLSDKTRIVAITHVSNSLGTINPIKRIIDKAHEHNIPVLIDGAQGIQHQKVDVQALDCDFYVFSGHKIYGPTGIGALYGKEKWLNEMPPYRGGGDMIKTVSFEKTEYADLPFKFEAGTTHYVGAIAMGRGLQYINRLGLENIGKYEQDLLQYATQKLNEIENVTIYGNAKHKSATISFLLDGIHSYDTGMILDKMGVAVRTGTHCTEPVMRHFGIDGTVRASFSFYNTKQEIDSMVEALHRVKQMFG